MRDTDAGYKKHLVLSVVPHILIESSDHICVVFFGSRPPARGRHGMAAQRFSVPPPPGVTVRERNVVYIINVLELPPPVSVKITALQSSSKEEVAVPARQWRESAGVRREAAGANCSRERPGPKGQREGDFSPLIV